MMCQLGALFSIELLPTHMRLGSAPHLGAGQGAAHSSLLREQEKCHFPPKNSLDFNLQGTVTK